MQEYTVPIIIVAFSILSLGMWFLITRTLMSLAGLSKEVDVEPLGEFVQSYGVGSMRIGLISFNNCVVFEEYQSGYLFRLWKIVGGGKRVVLFSDIASLSERPYLLFMKSRVLELTNGKRIRVYGSVAKRIEREGQHS
ncbi:MAG: hypothetical protein AB7H80_06600 [Candidatus Kapaibacterium sp.]